jgi:4-amino-4-deoxy-L-arabinose transferase-like glycosyltransferase
VHLGVLAFVLLLYIPMAGSYGFWDPWETHYAEVARQMLERGDWISLWWPGSHQDNPPLGEFWSKPVFTFWIFALSMKLFGLEGAGADPGEMALSYKVEWACRLPEALFGLMGVYAVFWATNRLINRRAAIIAAVACATSPMYALLSRQAMTDMPFVGPMTAALALAAVALLEDDGPELARGKLLGGRLSFPKHRAFYVALGTLLVLVVPQIVVDSVQLKVPYAAGSRRYIPGVVYMLPYLATLGLSLWLLLRARHQRQLYLHIAFALCGAATLAKGLVGVALPGMVILLYLVVAWDFRQLRRLEIPAGILIVVSVSFPWFQSMLLRHGQRFWAEFFGDNHWNRLAVGRHGDRGSFEYYVRELAYGKRIMAYV